MQLDITNPTTVGILIVVALIIFMLMDHYHSQPVSPAPINSFSNSNLDDVLILQAETRRREQALDLLKNYDLESYSAANLTPAFRNASRELIEAKQRLQAANERASNLYLVDFK